MKLGYLKRLFNLCIITLFMTAPGVGAANKTATISFDPSSGSQTVGSQFTVSLKLNTGGQPVSTIGIRKITYSSNLEYISADASGSVFSTEVIAPSPSNNSFDVERASLSSDYNGDSGLIIKLTFKPTSSGNATITAHLESSEVITSTTFENILNTINSASFTVNATTQTQSTASATTVATTKPVAKTTAKSSPTATKLSSTPSPSPTPSPVISATPVPTPVATPATEVKSFSTMVPWLVAGLVLAALLGGGVIYSLYRRHPANTKPKTPIGIQPLPPVPPVVPVAKLPPSQGLPTLPPKDVDPKSNEL